MPTVEELQRRDKNFQRENLGIAFVTLLCGGIAARYVVSSLGWHPIFYYLVPAAVFVVVGLWTNSVRQADEKMPTLAWLLWAMFWPIVVVMMFIQGTKS